jgi:hypothetical protein
MSAKLNWLTATSSGRLWARRAMALLPGLFSLSPHPDWLRGPPNLLPNGYLMFCPWRQSSHVVTSHVHLVCPFLFGSSCSAFYNYLINRRIFREMLFTRVITEGSRRGKWCCHQGWQSPRGGKMNILNEEFDFCAQLILNYWAKQKNIQNIIVIF